MAGLSARATDPSRKDIMRHTTYSLAPLWTEIRAELRHGRAARSARREFRRQLAAARTPADLGQFRSR
jgi:hypothetical protein